MVFLKAHTVYSSSRGLPSVNGICSLSKLLLKHKQETKRQQYIIVGLARLLYSVFFCYLEWNT